MINDINLLFLIFSLLFLKDIMLLRNVPRRCRLTDWNVACTISLCFCRSIVTLVENLVQNEPVPQESGLFLCGGHMSRIS